jgi:hypothetical protein
MQTRTIALDGNGCAFDWLESYMLFSWTETDMILKPSNDRGRKLTSPLPSRTSCRDRALKTDSNFPPPYLLPLCGVRSSVYSLLFSWLAFRWCKVLVWTGLIILAAALWFSSAPTCICQDSTADCAVTTTCVYLPIQYSLVIMPFDGTGATRGEF